eukprot:TRINITY_DN3364_c0_g2_i1.p1 TRINITY_DN3364_c0_g2~~TRINITY_DN3364_c0_g2_i1.p1  ORF type:complete len:537 (+),score=73.17 TRINITY_DN3364_c0_g2_i1:132-1742(+)
MGNTHRRNSHSTNFSGPFPANVQDRISKVSLSGRYHKLPRKITDDYDITNKVLGSGLNGVVREALRFGDSRQRFAVKAFKMLKVDVAQRMQLESEVQIFLVMDHPHIARLADVYDQGDYLYVVMECMDGGELFDRLSELTRFSERDAADSVWQMLLAVNYIHQHGIAHRDLKLENFVYDQKESDQLKLIDFGFSKMWDPNIKMHISCGTLSYVAPEVLHRSYTSQCDLWSLGVISFILLAGYMPFYGQQEMQKKNICRGKYEMKPEKWRNISKEAHNFVKSLLAVDPEKRLTAQRALEHPWMAKRHTHDVTDIDDGIADALRKFGQASKFRRCCLEMMAWSLSNAERAKVRKYFISMDANKHGTITLSELRDVLTAKFKVDEPEVLRIFSALDTNHDEEIHYSDFLAAMVSTRIDLHDELLRSAFNKFDVDGSGYITLDDLKEVLGENFEGEEMDKLLAEADVLEDGRISYAEFVAYLRQTPLETDKVIERGLRDANGTLSYTKGVPKLQMQQAPLFGSNEKSKCRKEHMSCCVIA